MECEVTIEPHSPAHNGPDGHDDPVDAPAVASETSSPIPEWVRESNSEPRSPAHNGPDGHDDPIDFPEDKIDVSADFQCNTAEVWETRKQLFDAVRTVFAEYGRSEERREGKKGVSKGESRWGPEH